MRCAALLRAWCPIGCGQRRPCGSGLKTPLPVPLVASGIAVRGAARRRAVCACASRSGVDSNRWRCDRRAKCGALRHTTEASAARDKLAAELLLDEVFNLGQLRAGEPTALALRGAGETQSAVLRRQQRQRRRLRVQAPVRAAGAISRVIARSSASSSASRKSRSSRSDNVWKAPTSSPRSASAARSRSTITRRAWLQRQRLERRPPAGIAPSRRLRGRAAQCAAGIGTRLGPRRALQQHESTRFP